MDLNPILAGLGGTPAPKTNAATEAMSGFTDMLRQAEQQAEAAITGSADPHALVTALAEGQMAVDTVVTIRDKVVEAYQEILRMPV
ncbi:flagellar hook-basal body complex protein FliE [Jannaschia helgolandensis]|uniref:Flagellar hook-basal body complex protein FliE n=1 Tax=Jannaschia helgolandensis TaxID=188906 RepID=A0A1H7H2Z3_9RHOB|nr:flagellar hook-basal body complex protein FliE [Jannaschia helgolandensis]SEK44681.1 flagellar hook-basal body complex protein FliE [Jannaschia helgolandensis]